MSTGRDESCKTLFCVSEIVSFSIIVFQYIIVFLLEVTIEIIRKPIFTEKLHCSKQKLFFLASEKPFFFQLSGIRGSENGFSQGKLLFSKFFIQTIGSEFYVQQKQYYFIQNSVEDFKIRVKVQPF